MDAIQPTRNEAYREADENAERGSSVNAVTQQSDERLPINQEGLDPEFNYRPLPSPKIISACYSPMVEDFPIMCTPCLFEIGQ